MKRWILIATLLGLTSGYAQIVQVQQAGVNQGVVPTRNYFVLNCVSGLTCSTSGVTISVIATSSGTVGAGTTNTVPKYTNGAGAVLGNSAITEDGTTMSIPEALNQGTSGNTAWAAGGLLSRYRGTATGGNGLVFVLGTPSNVVNQTASQTTVNLVSSTPSGGQYEIQGYLDERTACTTVSGSQVVVTFSWTDATSTRSKSFTLTFDTSNAAGDTVPITVPIFANNATAITYTTTYAGCATGGPAAYDLHVAVVQLQ